MADESAAGAVQQRRALLIGSPVFGLTGPKTDVETMSRALKNHGFETIELVGTDATRKKIRRKWNGIVENVSSEDVVVIYYSGHGGLAQSTKSHREYKFIVPFDFADSTSRDFRGILDIEIADLVQKTTDKTKNVTLVFDCCHSSQTAWDPWYGSDAARKSLRGIKKGYDLSKLENTLRDSKAVQKHAIGEVNEDVVRISATGAAGSAWEYLNEDNKRAGVFTKAFATVLGRHIPDGTTWRALLGRVCELIAYEFPSQRPWAEGPSNRVLFAMDRKKFDSLPVTVLGNKVELKAGREFGVQKESLYTIMSATYDEPEPPKRLGEARVTIVGDRSSDGDFSPTSGSDRAPGSIPESEQSQAEAVSTTEARAFLKAEPVYKWPVSIPKNNYKLEKRIRQSKYLRICEEKMDSGRLISFYQHDTTIFGFIGKDTMCISSKEIGDAVLKAEQLAKAQHLLTLTGGYGKAFLQHDLDIQFKIKSSERLFRKDGSDCAREDEDTLISLHNKGTETLYVSLFCINIWGGIHHVNRTCPLGISILPDRRHEIGQNFDFLPEAGSILGLWWPEDLPQDRPALQTLVFIVTKEEVDLRDFAPPREGLHRDITSELQNLAHRLSFLSGNQFPGSRKMRIIPYDVQRISWTLYPEIRTTRSQPERTSAFAATINGNLVNLNHYFPNSLFLDAKFAKTSNYILVHTKDTLRRAQLKELDGMGAVVQERIDNRLYLFHHNQADLEEIRQMDYIVDTAVYPNRVKVELELQKICRRDPEAAQDIIVAFHENKSHNIDSTIAKLEDIAGPSKKNLIRDRKKVRMCVQAATVFDLAAVDGVRTIEEVLEKVCFNNRARRTMKAKIAYNNTSFNGNRQTVAVADTGLDTGNINNIHPAFHGRILGLIPLGPAGDAVDRNGHGTHVCGSILGDAVHGANDVTQQGIAPEARLVVQAIADSQGRIQPVSLTDLFLDPYERHGTRIHNNSWGTVPERGQVSYNEDSRDIDTFVWEHPDMLICFAAGNYGQANRTLGGEAAAKNCLTVGAIDSGLPDRGRSRRRLRGQDGIWLCSSHGPTAERRIKPDVVAPGTEVFSARSTLVGSRRSRNNAASADGFFMHLSGTSMATALVSGCAAVLREVLVSTGFQNPSAALMKALLINGADSFNDADFRAEGFGRINLRNSIAHVRETDTAGILVGNPFEDEGYRTFSLPDNMPNDNQEMTLKVTMAYTDNAGHWLCNNLNLIVKAPDGAERHGNMGTGNGFDNRNNVEQVVWKGIPPGYVEITVRAVELLFVDQSFALIWRMFRNAE